MSIKKVLIFGATGTVGAYTALYLKDLGYEIYACGRRESDNGFFAGYGIPYYSVDVRRSEDFTKITNINPEAIINLSGMLPARMKGYFPQIYIDCNITGSLNILNYAVAKNIKRVVFTQSISDVAYLCNGKAPIPSDASSQFPIDNDHSIYSITKTAACNMLIHFGEHYGFKYFTLRFPNIYLYHPNPYYYVNGEEKMQSYRLMIQKAIKGEPLSIWGDPQKERDIVYVKDCCQIIEKCISADNPENGMYNVGTGIGTSMEDQVRGIVHVFSPKDNPSIISYSPEKPDSIEYIFDISKTRQQLGYVPQYDYIAYLEDLKKEMQAQRFSLLWGNDEYFK